VKPSLAGATLLFPTFAFIGYTYNGLRGWPSLRYYQSSAYSLGLLLASLPNGLKGWFASHVIGRQLWAQSHVQKAVLSGIADPHVARSALYMADHEMHEILQPPMQFMREHQHKLAFLYGTLEFRLCELTVSARLRWC
jgi:Lipid-droplet associated hydrolase